MVKTTTKRCSYLVYRFNNVLVWNLLLIMLFKSGAKQLDLLIHLLQRKKPPLLLEASLV